MISDYFMCQGDNLSPVHFALFINYFTEYVSTAYRGLNIDQSCYPSLINSVLGMLCHIHYTALSSIIPAHCCLYVVNVYNICFLYLCYTSYRVIIF